MLYFFIFLKGYEEKSNTLNTFTKANFVSFNSSQKLNKNRNVRHGTQGVKALLKLDFSEMENQNFYTGF